MAAARAKTKRSGGRPSKEEAELLDIRLLDAATELFLRDGYGVTSIEAVAARAGISKRTFYARYKDKAALFSASVHRLIERMKPSDTPGLFQGKNCEEILLQLARVILQAVLSPQALALHRIISAESSRFPELMRAVQEEGSRDMAINGIAALLEKETRAGRLQVTDPIFAAEQFMNMVISAPQRRAMGMGVKMNEAELGEWAEKSVALLLNGCRKA